MIEPWDQKRCQRPDKVLATFITAEAKNSSKIARISLTTARRSATLPALQFRGFPCHILPVFRVPAGPKVRLLTSTRKTTKSKPPRAPGRPGMCQNVPGRTIDFFNITKTKPRPFLALNHQSSITTSSVQNEPKPRHPVAPESHLFGEPSTDQNEPKPSPNPPSCPVRLQPATHCYTSATALPNPDTPPHPRCGSRFSLPLEPASPRKISPFYGSSRFWHSS
jgi:hypothetical protein